MKGARVGPTPLSYLVGRAREQRREIVTPEGVPLGLRLADAGERATAFLVDFLIICAIVLVLVLLAAFAGGGGELGGSWTTAFVLLASFLVRNFYFVFFELRWQGSTPGKRLLGLRVIDAHGGPLGAEAIVARNLVRDVEVFIPLAVLIAPEQLWPNAPGWARLVSSLWALVFALMPLFNKDRLRIGDMVGGTLVVLAPKVVLLPDMAAAGPAAGFTDEQLDVYGIFELQVLENVLRGAETLDRQTALDTVAERIKNKISWDRARWQVDSQRFLQDFYVALRARLERKMLFGKRRRDKYEK